MSSIWTRREVTIILNCSWELLLFCELFCWASCFLPGPALLLLPVTFSNFNFSDNETFLNISSYFTQGQPLYMLLYASGIIFFTFFYTSITFNPNETADNLRKYGGFIPGIRPGESTALYIENILKQVFQTMRSKKKKQLIGYQINWV